MKKAGHRKLFVRLFSFLSRRGLKKHFRNIAITCNADTRGRPVLLIGNRFGWWDPFIAYRLNDLLFHKKFHIMVLEEQLAARPVMNKAGAFPIKRASRTAIDTLKYASGLLHETNNLVALFPQVALTSIHRRPVRFERGVERIIAGASDRLAILFYVALPDWFTGKKPDLSIRIIEYTSRERSITDLEDTYNMFLDECIVSQRPPDKLPGVSQTVQ